MSRLMRGMSRLHLHADCELETGPSDAGSHWSSHVALLRPESTASCKDADEPGRNPSCNGLSSACDGTATVLRGGSSKVVCVMSPPPQSPGVRPEGHGVRVVPEGRPALGERNRGSDHNSGKWVPAFSQTAKPGDITQSGKEVASQLSQVTAYIPLGFLRTPK